MNQFSKAARKQLINVLAFSERTVRSLSAVAVGTSSLLTDTILPESLRGTTTYRVTLGMLQQYIMENVAEMPADGDEGEQAVSEDYVPRKMVGTALEAAGLLTMGFSPLWVFAILGDAVGGSKLYLNRLVSQLKADGVIEETAEISGLEELFTAVQDASSRSATAVDTPPLSREELNTLVNDLRTGYGNAFSRSTALLPQLDSLWARMEQLASRENISLERLSGLMTVDALSLAEKGVLSAQAAGKTTAQLFDEQILDSYRQTLTAVSEQGVDGYVRDHFRPFLTAARAQFDGKRQTWVERKLG